MSMIDIDVIWLLSLVYLLMRIIASFLRYAGNQSIIKVTFIANSCACTTNELSIIWTSCLAAIKNHVIKYVKLFLREMVKICFGLLKTQMRFLKKNKI